MGACQSSPAVRERATADNDHFGDGWRGEPSDILVDGAEAWPVDAWTRLPEGKSAPTLEDLEGLVVVLFCYQSW